MALKDVCILLLLPLAQGDFGKYRHVDLTHPQGSNALGWPTFKPFARKVAYKGYTEDWGQPDQWVEAYEFTQNEHLGTHMDAPLHFVPNGRTIDEIPLEQLAGNGVVFDMTQHEFSNYQFSVNDVRQWESKHGTIPDQAIILLNTGRSKFYSTNATRYYGFKTKEDADSRNIQALNWPGLSVEAAKWLLEYRNVLGYGIDCVSLDAGDVKTNFETHRVVLGANQYILENVGSNIKDLPARDFFLMAMPYKLQGGSGAPTRLVALLDATASDLKGLISGVDEVTYSVFALTGLLLTVLMLN